MNGCKNIFTIYLDGGEKIGLWIVDVKQTRMQKDAKKTHEVRSLDDWMNKMVASFGMKKIVRLLDDTHHKMVGGKKEPDGWMKKSSHR